MIGDWQRDVVSRAEVGQHVMSYLGPGRNSSRFLRNSYALFRKRDPFIQSSKMWKMLSPQLVSSRDRQRMRTPVFHKQQQIVLGWHLRERHGIRVQHYATQYTQQPPVRLLSHAPAGKAIFQYFQPANEYDSHCWQLTENRCLARKCPLSRSDIKRLCANCELMWVGRQEFIFGCDL